MHAMAELLKHTDADGEKNDKQRNYDCEWMFNTLLSSYSIYVLEEI